MAKVESKVFIQMLRVVALGLLCAGLWIAASPRQARTDEPVVPDWQRNGLLAALKDPSLEVLKETVLALSEDGKL
jgi:hypothetical protein